MLTVSRFLTTALAIAALAGARIAPAQSTTSDTTMAHAFAGQWACAGAFASGKPIASTLAIDTSLGGQWLEYHQDDVPPNRYHAIGTIGIDHATSLPVMVVHDNFGGVRFFTSGTAWRGGALQLETATAGAAQPAAAPARRERFTYTPGADTLRIRYEASRTPGVWQMGDTLTCTRH